MRRVTLIAALVAAALATVASDCDCVGGTRQTDCKGYAGDATALEPHSDTPELELTYGEIDTMVARVGLHNPTEAEAIADVSCIYWLDGWQAGDNARSGVEVCAESSVWVELQWGGDFLESQIAGVSCDVTWQ